MANHDTLLLESSGGLIERVVSKNALTAVRMVCFFVFCRYGASRNGGKE